MTVAGYAIYRFAARLMTPEEKARARELAKQAEGGDAIAGRALRALVLDVIADAKQRAKTDAQSANKK